MTHKDEIKCVKISEYRVSCFQFKSDSYVEFLIN